MHRKHNYNIYSHLYSLDGATHYFPLLGQDIIGEVKLTMNKCSNKVTLLNIPESSTSLDAKVILRVGLSYFSNQHEWSQYKKKQCKCYMYNKGFVNYLMYVDNVMLMAPLSMGLSYVIICVFRIWDR